jgi:small subunit ribosomal protein S6e
MKLNISYPPYKAQKVLEIDDERKLRPFYEKRISDEVAGDFLGDEFKGYVFRISGGHDKQGFAMKQGVAVNHRVRLLLDGSSGQYNPHRHGERRRKSVRGCIVANDLSVLALVIIKRGPADLAGLTDADSDKPSTRGPKRASNIRKVYALSKDDDVRQFVVRKVVKGKNGKKDTVKSPRIQRLVTPAMLQHKRRRIALKKRRTAASQTAKAEYNKIVTQLRKERRQAALSKKKSSKKDSAVKPAAAAAPAKAAPAKKDAKAAAPAKTAPAKKDAKATTATATKKDTKATTAAAPAKGKK